MAFIINSSTLNFLRVFAASLVFFCHSTIVARDCFGLQLQGFSRLIITPAWGGVWIFLIMGGFLAAYGFDSQKYSLNKEGLLMYYRGRFFKVLVPTWIFLSIMYIFNLKDSHLTINVLLKYLTCTYNGSGDAGIKDVGASWYVFMIMWLYLLMPFMLKGLHWFESKCIGREYKSYLRLLAILVGLGVVYRFGGYLLWLKYGYLIYYNWFYANVTATIDLFLIGMIGERLLHYLPKISDEKVRNYRKWSLWVMLIVACLFLGNYKYQRVIYLFVGPSMFSLSTIFMIMAFSYKSDSVESQFVCNRITAVCNTLAPYAFMFYLWHSPILGYVANKLQVEDFCFHYFVMLIIGGVATAYVSYLMTTMNQGIIKKILSKSE